MYDSYCPIAREVHPSRCRLGTLLVISNNAPAFHRVSSIHDRHLQLHANAQGP